SLYMVRLWRLVFLGTPRSASAEHAHEGGLALVLPLLVLAGLSVVGGYAGLYPAALAGVWAEVPHPHGAAYTLILAVSVGVMLLGAGLALWLYPPAGTDALERRAPGAFNGLAL